MDGVLEVKNEDILKQDIPRPEFMDDPELREVEWSEDQKKAAKEYEKRVKTLEEERLKHKKALEAELKKLQAGVIEGLASFDVTLAELFNRKILSQMAIHQEELRLGRLSRSLVWKMEAGYAENNLVAVIEAIKEARNQKLQLMREWKAQIEEQRTVLETRSAEDKLAEKQFKGDLERSFEGLGAVLIDSLAKAFKRRPKNGETLEEIEDFETAPAGTEEEVWVFVNQQRKEKLKIEEIEKILDELNHHQMNIEKSTDSLLIQLLLKQGQVEIESDEFSINFSNAVFLHRTVVEDLNSQIKHFGRNKIDAMLESSDFRKGIHLLEWERKKLQMTKDDLNQKAQDIQMLKLTRELQSVLATTGNGGQMNSAAELARIDRTLKSQNEAFRIKSERKKAEMKKVRRQMTEIDRDNLHLTAMLEDLHVSVSERRNIQDTHIQPDTRKMMRDIARNRKLAEISRAQHNEIVVLKQELERLRKKTFPALVKITR